MNLTSDEYDLLATCHGNAAAVREVRRRLTEAGLRYCPKCGSVKPLESFSDNGNGYPQTRCRPCTGRLRKRTYVRVGDTERERHARYREAHPEREKARKKAAYEARKAAGMTGRQANYMEPVL